MCIRDRLCINREEIIRYLQQIGQNFVTDSTNLEDEYTRNKIRLNLLPLMQEINPSVKNSLIETSNHLNDVATTVSYTHLDVYKRQSWVLAGKRYGTRPATACVVCC